MTDFKKCKELEQIVKLVYFTNFKSMVQMYIRWEGPKKVRVEEIGMNEVKTPKKPFYVYYAIVLLALFLINALLVPQIAGRMVKQVDYDTFMKMTLDKQIDEVEVQDNQIIFTAKDDKTIYKTGVMNDPDLTQRLYDSGAKFSSEIVEQVSPMLSFFISWILRSDFLCAGSVDVKEDDEKNGWQQFHDVWYG